MTKNLLTFLCVLVLTGLGQLIPTASASERPMLKRITFAQTGQNREEIVFQLNGTYIPKTFAIKGKKPRVVFDFYGVGQAFSVPNTITADGQYVEQIRIGRHEGPSPKTRVVFDLAPGKKLRFSQEFNREKNTLTIAVLPVDEQNQSKPRATIIPAKKTPAVQSARQTASPPDRIKQKKTRQTVSQPKENKPTVVTPKNRPGNVQRQPVVPAQQTPAAPKIPVENSHNTVTGEDAPADMPSPSVQPSADKNTKPSFLESVVFDNSSRRGEMVQFTLTNFHPPKVFGIEEGVPRVVCDFTATQPGKKLPKKIKAHGRWVKTIRIGSHSNPDRVRVVIDLAPNNIYDLQQVFFTEENLFVIIVNAVKDAKTVNSGKGLKKEN